MPGHNEDAVDAVVRQLGLDEDQAEELSREVEERKRMSGRGGSDNLDFYEILEIAHELFG